MKLIKLKTTLSALVLCLGAQAKEKEPATITQELTINAPLSKAWKVLGPQFADAHIWASSITHSEGLNTESLNGSTCTERGCSIKGMGDIKEKLLSYSEVEHSLSYVVHQGMPKMVTYAANHWQLTDLGNGQTKLVMNIQMETGGLMGRMMKGMMNKKMTKLSSEIIEEFKFYVENGQPHARTVKATK